MRLERVLGGAVGHAEGGGEESQAARVLDDAAAAAWALRPHRPHRQLRERVPTEKVRLEFE